MSKGKLLKSTSKKKPDPQTEAALETVRMEKERDELQKAEAKKREQLIAEAYRKIGQIETADLFGKFLTVSSLVWLQQAKESKIYKDIPGIGTWASFCNQIGKSHKTIDEQLLNLDALGEDFLLTVSSFKIGYRDLRKLRKSISDGEIIIDDQAVQINGEKIPFSPDNKEDLQAAIESVIEAKDRKLEETAADLKAKDRVLKEKERVIRKQEKDLNRYEKEIKERDFKPGEENFIKEMEKQKLAMISMALMMDPDNVPEDATPLMISTYIETLGHMRRTISSYYDLATERYGDFEDDGWDLPIPETD